ncbi:MAG TPA: arginyltransferase [Gammaproteobacteria bacterium]
MDSIDTKKSVNSLAFFASEPHACSYLDNRTSISLFADPTVPMTMPVYSRLADYGFRRSGPHIYAPNCPHCQSCIPIRLPVDHFKPNRSQKRVLNKNVNLTVKCLPAAFHQEHFELYQRYLSCRHAGSSMENPSADEYLSFLASDWSETYFYEFRENDRLLAVTVADKLTQGLSAVYTFFDPAYAARGLGNFAVLWLAQETQSLQLRWLYLGYWIPSCRKMQYKSDFKPAEIFSNGRWTPLTGAYLANI